MCEYGPVYTPNKVSTLGEPKCDDQVSCVKATLPGMPKSYSIPRWGIDCVLIYNRKLKLNVTTPRIDDSSE